jgi:hypothetical protein
MAIVKLVVHEFFMSDIDDIEIYVAEPLWKWETSEPGRWVMEHAVETPYWTTGWDTSRYGMRVIISAELREEDATFFKLKYCDYSKSKAMG